MRNENVVILIASVVMVIVGMVSAALMEDGTAPFVAMVIGMVGIVESVKKLVKGDK